MNGFLSECNNFRYVNRCFSCLHKNDLKSQRDGLFIRVNGEGREALEKIWFCKGHALRYLKEMNKHKIGMFSFLSYIQ